MSSPLKRRERIIEYGLRSMCTFPLKVQDETVAVIAIYSEQPNYFGPSEVETSTNWPAELAYGVGRLRDSNSCKRNEESRSRQVTSAFVWPSSTTWLPCSSVTFEDRVIAVNDSFCRLVGFSREELMGHDSKQFTYPDDVGITEETLVRLSSEQVDQVRYVKRYLRKDGRIIVSEVSRSAARDASGKILYFVSSERDITEERTLADQLSHQALHDSLTGLANRALFEDRLAQAHARIARQGGSRRRAAAGPGRLQGCQRRPRSSWSATNSSPVSPGALSSSPASPTRCRALVAMSSSTWPRVWTSAEEAEEVAARLIDVLAEPFSFNGLSLDQHASVGIIVLDETCEDSSELIQKADVALYEAKRLNRGRYSLFTPSMHQQAVSHFELVQELRRALQTGDLSMHYQPIVKLDSTDVVGFEALMRWQHPERGWVPPNSLFLWPNRATSLWSWATSPSPRPSKRRAPGKRLTRPTESRPT